MNALIELPQELFKVEIKKEPEFSNMNAAMTKEPFSNEVKEELMDEFEVKNEPIDEAEVKDELVVQEVQKVDDIDEEVDIEGVESSDSDEAPITKDENTAEYKCSSCKEVFSDINNLTLHIAKHADDPEKKLYQCAICEFKFVHPSRILRHVVAHNVVRRHPCKICTKTFKDRYQLKQHEIIHNAKSYHCRECNEYFRLEQFYKTHMEHHKSGFKCDKCNKLFGDQQDLITHRYERHLKEHTCPCCNLQFSTLGKFKAHMKKQKKNGIVPDMKCHICDKQFTRRFILKRHLSVVHMLKCMICDEIFHSKELLKKHTNTVHDNFVKKSFQCNFCGKSNSGKFPLERHISRFHNLECKHCNLTFTQNNDYIKHMDEKHKVQIKFNCEVCNQTFTRMGSLDSHTERFHKHKCDFCDQIFEKRNLQINHMKKEHFHEYKRPHPVKCGICNKLYNQLNRFPTHYLKLHKGQQFQYQCVDCGHISYSEEDFENHTEVHGKINNLIYLECYICNKLFSGKNNLSRHYKTIHPSEIPLIEFKCKECNQVFADKADIKAHLKVHLKTGESEDMGNDDIFYEDSVEIGLYECTQCFEAFESFSELEVHSKVHIEAMDEEMGLYECIKCDEAFQTYDEFEAHSESHIETLNSYDGKSKIVSIQSEASGSRTYFKPSDESSGNGGGKTYLKIEPVGKIETSQTTIVSPSKIEVVELFGCVDCEEIFESDVDLKEHSKVHSTEIIILDD